MQVQSCPSTLTLNHFSIELIAIFLQLSSGEASAPLDYPLALPLMANIPSTECITHQNHSRYLQGPHSQTHRPPFARLQFFRGPASHHSRRLTLIWITPAARYYGEAGHMAWLGDTSLK
ncbi:hypothetical protein CBL_11756 [Carabus blaptoides fortunei]